MKPLNHHGLKEMPQLRYMCSHQSIHEERIGRFGRIFQDHPAMMLNPSSLIEMGKKGGPMDGGTSDDLTQNVPLGMVYLGQFIDHDITLDTTSSFNTANEATEIENFRTPALDLDCIFGEGPEDEPFLYESNSLRLLTGKTNNNIGQGVSLESEDLARNGQGKAIIGDPRNDENRIISQLQLAFIRFYNAIYTDIESHNPTAEAKHIYEEARKLTTWHYQWIVIYEFLPTMCGEVIVDKVLGRGRQYYKPYERAFIPVEFSIGTYRFGHSMITQKVKLKQGGSTFDLFSNNIGGGFSKITSLNQVIDWECFFDFDGSYQRAAKLDMKLASTLLELPFVQPVSHLSSLATRNLLRGQSFFMPSGEVIAECMGREASEIADVRSHILNTINGHDIDFDSGSPLWAYVLAEAADIGRHDKDGFKLGEGMGPVGGTITAEVIIGLMELDANSFMGSDRNWQPTLGTGGKFTIKDLLTISKNGI